MQQWTGKEHKEMQRIFVTLIAGAVSNEVLTIVQAVVDFVHYAQFQIHTTASLSALKAAYNAFHKHKNVFIALNIREHFNIPKLHSMQHYLAAIQRKGALDGFNTELSERLHIDYAKRAYRSGNRRDYIANMTTWLRRQDAVDLRSAYLTWWDKRQDLELEARAVPQTVRLDTHTTQGIPLCTTMSLNSVTPAPNLNTAIANFRGGMAVETSASNAGNAIIQGELP